MLIPQKEINAALNRPVSLLETISVFSIKKEEDVELDFIIPQDSESNKWDAEF